MAFLLKTSGQIRDYKIEEKLDNSIYVTIIIDTLEATIVLKYRIAPDTNQPELSQIKKDFEEGLRLAKENNSNNISIEEYLERSYIFVKFPNVDSTKKYTAQRII